MFWRSRGERHAALALALALALAPRVEGGLYATDGPVVTIRPYQLHAIRTDPQRAWVVEAYASWCGHCQAFAPTFEALARNLSAYHEVVGVGAIDCAVDTAACIAIGVTGYPTLFVWGKGTPFNATAEPPSPSPSPPLPLVRMGKPAIAELEETASDGAPMHDGGFVSEDELFDWLLPKLPRLYLTLPDATTAASAAAAASARNESLALFWPSELGGSGDSETAQRLALDFAGRALFGQLAHPADALAALGLADQFLTSQLAPEPVSRLARARAPAAALRAAASGETEDRLAPTLLVFNRPAMLAAAAAHVSTAASNVAAEAAAAAEVAMAERDAGSGGLRALAAAATAGLTRTLREKALPAQDPPRLTLTQRLAAARAARKENANATVARPPPAAAKPRAAAAKPAAAPAPVTRPTATALVPAGASPGYVAYTASFAALAPVETWLRRILPPRPAAPAPPSPSPSAAELVVVGAGPVEASLVDLCAAVEFAFASDVPLAIGGGGAGGALGGDGLIALRAFLRLLTAAFPAVANRRALEGVRAAVETAAASGNLTAAQWANATRGFALPEPAASASARAAARGRAWVQCAGSRAELRGYPCSLWLLFHALLANADAGPAPADAAPPSGSASSAALGAITGYVRHFFGCLECRAHFVTMAANLTQDLANGAAITKPDSSLWLWQAHNLVNARLAYTGGASNDPAHPKLAFPSVRACGGCRDAAAGTWRVPEVYAFLREAYCSRQPGDEGFECARDRASLAAAVAALPHRPTGWRGFGFGAVFLGLCWGCAALPWLCGHQFARWSQQLDELEDLKLSARLDAEAERDESDAKRAQAETPPRRDAQSTTLALL